MKTLLIIWIMTLTLGVYDSKIIITKPRKRPIDKEYLKIAEKYKQLKNKTK